MMYWQTKQFWLDAAWRGFRTFCQSLAGLLVAVQSSNQIATFPTISIPWYGYLYSSAIAAIISLCQSIDRERAVATTPPVVVEVPISPGPTPADTGIVVASPAAQVVPMGIAHTVVTSCGDSPKV